MPEMTERNAKSAPNLGGKKDKTVTSIKEIHAWVHKGNSDQGTRKTARNTGLLTENVTEERLLFNRQLELGRERYKFLTNHAYEKHKFIERQKLKNTRRNSVVILPGTSLSRKRSLTVKIPQVDELSLSSGEIEKIDEAGVETVLNYERENNEKYEIHLPKTAIPRRPDSSNRGIYVDSSKSAKTKLIDSIGKLPAVTVTSKNDKDWPKAKFIDNFIGKTSTSTPNEGGMITVTNNIQHITPAIESSVDMKALATNPQSVDETEPMWAYKRRNSKRVIRYGEKFASSVYDPRYMALEESLVPFEVNLKRLDDVNDIIRKHEILQKESKSFKTLNSKYSHQKFLAFLLQKELTI